MNLEPVITFTGGLDRGTWVIYDVGIDYAERLCPIFKMTLIKSFKALLEGDEDFAKDQAELVAKFETGYVTLATRSTKSIQGGISSREC